MPTQFQLLCSIHGCGQAAVRIVRLFPAGKLNPALAETRPRCQRHSSDYDIIVVTAMQDPGRFVVEANPPPEIQPPKNWHHPSQPNFQPRA